MKITVPVFIAALAWLAAAQPKPDAFPITVTGVQDAQPVADALIKKLNGSKPFVAVGPKDDSKVSMVISCMDRDPGTPFACMYIAQLKGAAFNTLLGGGLFIAKDADQVANNFLASIAQDILERFENTNKENLRVGLEACLFLTDSKCNVPGLLQKELNATQLTLGQYIVEKQH